jgi:hypothetical protein
MGAMPCPGCRQTHMCMAGTGNTKGPARLLQTCRVILEPCALVFGRVSRRRQTTDGVVVRRNTCGDACPKVRLLKEKTAILVVGNLAVAV